jgi:hypothetical protein
MPMSGEGITAGLRLRPNVIACKRPLIFLPASMSHLVYHRGGHTILQTSRPASRRLEISNAAPAGGDCDPDCE